VVREVFGLGPLRDEIERLDNIVPTEAQHVAYHEIRRLIDRATRWFLDARFPIGDVSTEIERYQSTVQRLGAQAVELVQGAERQTLLDDAGKLSELGLTPELSLRLVELLSTFLVLDVVEISQATGEPADSVAAVHFELSDRLSIDNMLTKITALPRDDRWSTLARAAVRHDAYGTLAAITTAVVTSTDAGESPMARIEEWVEANPERVERAITTVGEALTRESVDLATLSVALRSLRSLAG
jgi:glutamate dehydrogenase